MLKGAWLIVLAAALLGATLGGVVTRAFYTPEYTVEQVFTIELENNPKANAATITDNQLSKTIPSLLCSDTFMGYMQKYIEQTGVKGKFYVTSLEHANIFYLTAISDSNESCMTIINEIQKRYGGIFDRVIGESRMKFLAPASESPLPSNTPNFAFGMGLGALIALLLCFGAIFLKSYMTDTINSPADISELGRGEYLGSVHRVFHKKRSSEEKKNKNRLSLVTDSNADLKLCQDISAISAKADMKCRQNGYKEIMVTSTLSGEGKSSVSLNLACDLADKGKRVLIIDFDLRSPCIAQRLGLKHTECELSQAIKKGSCDYIAKTQINNLFFAGNTSFASANMTMAEFEQIRRMLNEQRNNFDYIIIDTPPSDFLSDSEEIGEYVDAFIYVISQNAVSKSRVLRTLSGYDTSKCKMLGYVINFA